MKQYAEERETERTTKKLFSIKRRKQNNTGSLKTPQQHYMMGGQQTIFHFLDFTGQKTETRNSQRCTRNSFWR